MYSFVIRFFLFCAFLSAPLTYSQDLNQAILFDISLALIDEENHDPNSFTTELRDGLTGDFTLSYEAKLHPMFGLGIGYTLGDSGQVDILIDWFTDTEVNYSALSASAKFFLPITKRQNLFLSLNHYKYDFEVLDDSMVIEKQDGTDTGYTLGWRANVGKKMGLELSHEHLPLGSDLTIKSINIGVQYRF